MVLLFVVAALARWPARVDKGRRIDLDLLGIVGLACLVIIALIFIFGPYLITADIVAVRLQNARLYDTGEEERRRLNAIIENSPEEIIVIESSRFWSRPMAAISRLTASRVGRPPFGSCCLLRRSATSAKLGFQQSYPYLTLL